MVEVAGVNLSKLDADVHDAVKTYQDRSSGWLFFDPIGATKFELTPDKPNSARSVTRVTDYVGKFVGDLFTIVFKPGDGSGDESSYRVTALDFDYRYPKEPKAVPRSKEKILAEVFLPILMHKIESPNACANQFFGTLDLLGIKPVNGKPRVIKLATLGSRLIASSTGAQAYYTCGERETDNEPDRFGDPHAVYNSLEKSVVIASFLAVARGPIERSLLEALKSLSPLEPRWS